MSAEDLVFIDANQYLDLYRIVSGEKLLTPLRDHQGHILVTRQVVDEVQRNKVRVTASFLNDQLENFDLNSIAVPKHLVGNADDRVVLMGEQVAKTRRKVKETKEEFKKLTHEVLEQVSQSRDQISRGLANLFSQAVAPDEGELNRARGRKERGNPPGKQDDPLGDQLSWEQILSHCKDKPRLWVITKDSDYGTVYAGKVFLNAALYQELAWLYQSEPAVFCFDNIAEGLGHFANTTGAKAEKPLTPEETEQIKKEQESLPPLGWLRNYDDSPHIVIRPQDTLRMSGTTEGMEQSRDFRGFRSSPCNQ